MRTLHSQPLVKYPLESVHLMEAQSQYIPRLGQLQVPSAVGYRAANIVNSRINELLCSRGPNVCRLENLRQRLSGFGLNMCCIASRPALFRCYRRGQDREAGVLVPVNERLVFSHGRMIIRIRWPLVSVSSLWVSQQPGQHAILFLLAVKCAVVVISFLTT